MKDGKAVIDLEAVVQAVEESREAAAPKRTVQETGNKASRAKQVHSERWTLLETEEFFMALQIFGTDFGMVANFLQKRTREQVKNKYKKESRLNSGKVEYAVSTKMEVGKEAYERLIAEL